MTDKRVIACNLRDATKIGMDGALCYLIGVPGNPASIRVLVRSRSGRWVDRWERRNRLTNFRIKSLPPEHPKYPDERIYGGDVDATLAWLTSL